MSDVIPLIFDCLSPQGTRHQSGTPPFSQGQHSQAAARCLAMICLIKSLWVFVETCGEDGIGVEGTAATNGPLPIVPVTHHLLQGLLLCIKKKLSTLLCFVLPPGWHTTPQDPT